MHTVLHRIEQSLAIVLVSVAVAGIITIFADHRTQSSHGTDYELRIHSSVQTLMI